MNDEARIKLKRFIKQYGREICNTPRSAEMFLLTQLGEHPDERKVLVEALQRGMVAQLLPPLEGTWEEVSARMVRQLEKAATMSEADARWAIDSWGLVLKRHPDTQEVVPAGPPPPPPDPAEKEKAQAAQAGTFGPIVTLGGALGGGVGGILIGYVSVFNIGALFMMDVAAQSGEPELEQAAQGYEALGNLMILVFMVVGAVAGTIGSAVGWLVARGDRNPWPAFAASFMGGLFGAAIGGVLCGVFGVGIGCLIATASASMGVAYRGGGL